MFWRRKQRERDLDRELRSHLESEAEERSADGVSPEETRYAAQRTFGNTTLVKEATREMWGWTNFEQLWQDVRYALRQLSRSKGFTSTAVLTLALGIGANTAIFTLLHAVMLKSLPVPNPQKLVRLGDGFNCCVLGGLQGRVSVLSYPLYTYLRDHTSEFEQMAAFQAGLAKVGVRRSAPNAASVPLADQFVSGNFFSTLGLQSFTGRLLSPADDVPGAQPVAVMSYRAWEREYGSDPSLIGSTVVIDGAPFTLVGIAPPGFFGAMMRPDPPDVWMPISTEPAAHRQNSLLDANLISRSDEQWLYVIGRIRSGVNLTRVEAEVNVELRQWLQAANLLNTPQARRELDKQYIALVPAGGGVAQMKSDYERDLRWLIAITTLVLLIACANLANLQLARGATNVAQISIRVALGAPRSRVIRQVLTESVILALAGGTAGLLLAWQLAAVLVHLAFPGAQYVPIQAAPSLSVLVFTFGLSLATGLIFGFAPAWSVSRTDPAAALQGVGRSTAHISIRQRLLMVLQAALSLVLLSSAGLMILTLRNLQDQQFGFPVEGAAVVNVNAGFGEYPPEKLATVYQEIERRMRLIPGVRGASLALYSPMSGYNWQSGVTLQGRPPYSASPTWDRVSPSFFETLGVGVLRGRTFSDHDTPASTHVAVVNQSFANSLYPNEDPIGKRFGLGGVEESGAYQIVGVVNNITFRDLRQPVPPPMFFLPLLQMSKQEWENTGKARSNFIQCIVLRVAGHPPDLAAQVQHALATIDSNLTMVNLVTMGDQVDRLLRHERLIARLAEVFGLLGVILASIGLYGLTAYVVARRTSEIGIRRALGATRFAVVQTIVSSAMAQIGIGLAIGVACSFGAGRLLAGQLYGINASDPFVMGGAVLLIAVSTAAASIIPAIRAISIDPIVALRHE